LKEQRKLYGETIRPHKIEWKWKKEMEISSDIQKNRKEMKVENEKLDKNKYLHKQIQEIRSSKLISVPVCLMQ
jgi:hypothetical protein